jgi:hypothetical protein
VTLPSAWRGVAAGLAAGLVAAAAMDMFQRGVAKLQDSDGGDSATTAAADKLSEAATGTPVPDLHKAAAGQAMHYGFGALLGVGYGVLAEYWPQVTTAAGAPFGLATTVLIDEGAVPLAGLGDAPWKAPASTHVYSAASHLVFGTAAEATRRLARRAL